MNKKITVKDDQSWWLVKTSEDICDDEQRHFLVQSNSMSGAISKINKKEKKDAASDGCDPFPIISCELIGNGDLEVVE